MSNPPLAIAIQGIADAIAGVLQYGRDTDLSGMVGEVAVELSKYAQFISDIDTGALQSAHRMQFRGGSMPEALVYIDPGVINWRGQRPSVYGPYEDARGGGHAFYARTVDEDAEAEVNKAFAHYFPN